MQTALMRRPELSWILPGCKHTNVAGSFIARLFQHFECKLSLETSSVIRTEFNTSLAMLQHDAFFITSADLHASWQQGGAAACLRGLPRRLSGYQYEVGVEEPGSHRLLEGRDEAAVSPGGSCILLLGAGVDGTSGSGEPPVAVYVLTYPVACLRRGWQ